MTQAQTKPSKSVKKVANHLALRWSSLKAWYLTQSRWARSTLKLEKYALSISARCSWSERNSWSAAPPARRSNHLERIIARNATGASSEWTITVYGLATVLACTIWSLSYSSCSTEFWLQSRPFVCRSSRLCAAGSSTLLRLSQTRKVNRAT